MSDALVLAILVPFAGGVAAVFLPPRVQSAAGVLIALGTAALVGAGVVGLSRDGPYTHELGGWPPPLGIALHADGASALMLLLTAVVALMVSVHATAYFSSTAHETSAGRLFWPLWLLLWGGLNAVFVCRDAFTLYLLLEFTLLAAVALSALGGSVAAHVSALRYLLAATTAALFYLLGVGLLYADAGTLDLAALARDASGEPLATIGLMLMVGALVLKSALFPLHFWLPAAHSTAPAPVSAALSALVVKASFYVIVRLWVEALPVLLPVAGQMLAALGAAAVVWGSWLAIRQHRLKMLIAYSTVAQIGYLFLLLPLADVARHEAVRALTYHMVSHGLAKAAMFLAAGAVLKSTASDLLEQTRGTARQAPIAVATLCVAGAALAGVLPGGGSKGAMITLSLDHGQWWWAAAIAAGMVLAGAYTWVAVRPAFAPAAAEDADRPAAPVTLQIAALVLAVASVALSFWSKAALSLLEIGAP